MKFPYSAKILLISTTSVVLTNALADTKSNDSWKPFREVVFDAPAFPSTGSTNDRVLLQEIWSKELKARRIAPDGQKFAAFTLIGNIQSQANELVFSFYNGAGSGTCEFAANGAGAHDIYTLCTMRLIVNKGQRVINLPNYCMLYGGSDHDKNRLEYRFNQMQQAIEFRAWQYGKIVPACNRTLKLTS